MKNIKIGSLFILIFFAKISAEVSIGISSAASVPIKSVTAGVPFNLTVSVKNEDQVSGNPEIKGLSSVQVLNAQRSNNTTIINGKKSTEEVFVYQVRVDRPGNIVLGPVKVKTAKSDLTSNVLEFEVKKIEEIKDDSVTESIFYKIKVNKKNIYVGEIFNYELIFASLDDNVYLSSIQPPELKDLFFSKAQGPYEKTEIINGKKYKVNALNGTGYAKVSGEVVVPALKAVYRRGFFQNVVYSNPISLNIKNLPGNKAVDGVGNFTKFHASLSKTSIKQTEASILNITIEGEGNFELVKFPKLNLPKELQYFESTEHVDKNLKKFEYVIQPVGYGDVEIPAQVFNFFDPKEIKYKKLYTKKIRLNILKDEKPIPESEPEKEAEEDRPSLTVPVGEVVNVLEPISWWVFILLLILPVIMLGVVFRGYIYSKIIFWKELYKRKYAFYFAKKELRRAERGNSPEKIYGIFLRAFERALFLKPATYFDKLSMSGCKNNHRAAHTECSVSEIEVCSGKPNSVLTDEIIEKELKEKGLAQEQIEQWREFNKKLLLYSYYIAKDNQKHKELFKESYKWAKLFSGIFVWKKI